MTIKKEKNQISKKNLCLKVFEAFAGYGGASFGLKKSRISHKVVGFSEFDKFASAIFELNHPDIKNYGDITLINPEELPDFNFFTGGFPCQPFSSAGLGKGELDIRGTLFYDVIRICQYKKPEHILLENVKGLTTKRHTETFEKILSELKRIGYEVHWKLLNSKDYGIPQNRERLWIYGYYGKLNKNFNLDPPKKELKGKFKDFLDENPVRDLYLNKKQIERLIEKHGVDFNVKEPLCLDIYNKKIRHDGISITITEPHHNSLRVVEKPQKGKFIVRKLSKTEHYRLMGFDDGEFKFGDFSYQQICKRAGNGWDVNIVSILTEHIFNQLN
jgi:DNA (cytosine-5)-methyltransferase 1